jgi:hypothetical protein
MRLTRVLRFPAKTASMAVMLMAPLSWLTAQALLASHCDLQSTRIELTRSPLIGRTLEVIAQMQTHRGLINLSLAGDSAATGALAPTRLALKATIGAVQSTLLQHPELDLGSTSQPIREVLGPVADGNVPTDAVRSFRLHTEPVEALRHFCPEVRRPVVCCSTRRRARSI